jgi:hypothetical protein
MTKEIKDLNGKVIYIHALTEDGEIYRCNTAKAISSVRIAFKCDEERAINLLQASDYDHPLSVDDEKMWLE